LGAFRVIDSYISGKALFCDSVVKENAIGASLVKHFSIVRLNLRLRIAKVIHCKVQVMYQAVYSYIALISNRTGMLNTCTD